MRSSRQVPLSLDSFLCALERLGTIDLAYLACRQGWQSRSLRREPIVFISIYHRVWLFDLTEAFLLWIIALVLSLAKQRSRDFYQIESHYLSKQVSLLRFVVQYLEPSSLAGH